jgi:hypothetical protein
MFISRDLVLPKFDVPTGHLDFSPIDTLAPGYQKIANLAPVFPYLIGGSWCVDEGRAEGYERLDNYLDHLSTGTVVFVNGFSADLPRNGKRLKIYSTAARRSTHHVRPIPYWFELPATYFRANPLTQRPNLVSFVGSTLTWPALRKPVINGLYTMDSKSALVSLADAISSPSPDPLILDRETYHFFLPLIQQKENRAEFWKVTSESIFVLCPRGDNVGSVRFYEALACGCIPVLIADDQRLPLSHLIKWDEHCVMVPEKHASHCADYIRSWCYRAFTNTNSVPINRIEMLDYIGNLNYFIYNYFLHWTATDTLFLQTESWYDRNNSSLIPERPQPSIYDLSIYRSYPVMTPTPKVPLVNPFDLVIKPNAPPPN